MHPFVNKTLQDLIYQTNLITDSLLLKPAETVGELKPATFIDFTPSEIKEIRIVISELISSLEKLYQNSSAQENELFLKSIKSIKDLYNFLFQEGISRAKTFRVYESFIERKYIEKIRLLRFEIESLSRKLKW